MDLLICNLLPAIAGTLGGYVLARRTPVDITTLGFMLMYFVSPAVSFGGILKAELSPAVFILPVAAFVIGSLNSLLGRAWSRRVVRGDETSLIVASSASSANTLYFGFGIAAAVLPPEALPLFLLTCVGLSLSEAVWGYYFLARGKFDMRMAMLRVLKLPVISAVALGLLARLAGLSYSPELAPLFDTFRGALVLLGSSLLGVALGRQKRVSFDIPLIGAILFGRHLTYAALTAGFIVMDALWIHALHPVHHAILAVFTVLPIANNNLTFAVNLGLSTCRISSAIAASNVVAILLAFGLPFLMERIATPLF